MASEWTTVVRQKTNPPTRNDSSHSYPSSYMIEKKNREILERVQQGSLDLSEATRMLSSTTYTNSNAFQRKTHTRSDPKFTLTRNGGVALHGFHLRPIVLYANRWQELKTYINSGALEKFLDDNKNEIRRPNKPWHGSALTTSGTEAEHESLAHSAPTAHPAPPSHSAPQTSTTTHTHTLKPTSKDKHAGKPTLLGE